MLRKLNQFYAWLFGYFWLPCPLCSQMFGGHEWTEHGQWRNGKGICVDCFKKLGPEITVFNTSQDALEGKK